MRRILWVFGLVLVFSFIASAQNAPKAEIFGGYTYNRVSGFTIPLNAVSQQLSGRFPIPTYDLNGWTGSVNVKVYSWLGATGEFSDLYGTPIKAINLQPVTSKEHQYSYLFGPRVSVSYRHERWTPFFQALFGGAHGTALVTAPGVTVPFQLSERKFALAIGGGLDLKLRKHVAVRLVQAEYGTTHFESSMQKNIRVSTGIEFRF